MYTKLVCLLSFVLVLSMAVGAATGRPLNQDPGPDGIVSVEAEHYDNSVPRGGVQWELVGPTGGFTGVAGMQANGGGQIDTNYAATSPQLDYEIDFVKTGPHYVWIRGWGAGGGDDSCHAGLDGEETPLSNRMTGWSTNYTWANGRYERPEPSQIDILTTGLHVLNVWMREDGLIIDKIVLTTNPDYIPTGDGPPESTQGPRVTAYDPNPADGATDVPRDVVLSWTPGANIDSHDVYFGTNPDDVNQATTTADPGSVYQGRIDPNMYALPERLSFGQSYYWRIDEVNTPPDNTIHKGGLWSFTAELFAYPVENVIATASSSEEGKGPENTVNGSGLDSTGLLHGNISIDTMWLSSRDGVQPTWIQFEFDRVYKLYEMWVWNSNDSLEQLIGLGFKDLTIEYSTDGVDFLTLGTTHEFSQGPGAVNYAHDTTVDFEGVAARFVRLTANSNWGGIFAQYGLSEVRFFHIPVNARYPRPASGATNIGLDVTLGWTAGREAGRHDVYLSSDMQAVMDGTAPVTGVTETHYGPVAFDLGTTYYWRVDESNDVETPAVWPGDIWSFRTQEFFVVDDFESYDAADNQIWHSWHDGLGYGTPGTADYFAGNGTGAAVGDETTASFTEETIVHDGSQAMPLSYDNNKPDFAKYSETELKLTATRDWTERGVGELSIWFHGRPASVGSFVEAPVGTYTLAARGADIWNQADEFHFAYKMLTGVGSIEAKVESVERTDVWAKCGVMIRETLDPGSKFAAVYITPTAATGTATNGCRYQARTDTDGSATSDTSVATPAQMAIIAPYWVKLERDVAGNFRGYYSSNGTSWTPMSWNPQTITMASNVYVGLALTSHNNAATCTAKFSSVRITGTAGPQWAHQDIGIASNAAEPLYVAASNSTGQSAVVVHDDANAATIDAWTEWVIPLQAFADQGINLTNVDRIALGMGTKGNTAAGGSGKMYFDDIRLYRPRTAP